jgi:2-oxoglutarate ferredoxin oxidoreductase subunit delta
MAKPVKPKAESIIKSGLVSQPGAPLAAPHMEGKLLFFHEWCKRCGLCTVICPQGALEQKADGTTFLPDQEKCTQCSLCTRICPDFAIVLNTGKESKDDETK